MRGYRELKSGYVVREGRGVASKGLKIPLSPVSICRDRKSKAHDLTVAQPVSDTHLCRPGVGPILPNEVLAQTWAKIQLLVILIRYF
jgi:hypothetical protein